MKPLTSERAPNTDVKGTEPSDTRPGRIDVVVICNDDSLLIELGPVLSDRYRIHSIDTPADIGGSVSAACWIGIVDVDGLPDARAAVTRLELQHQRCPLILIASRPEEWAAAIARGVALAAIGREEVATVRLGEALLAAEGQLQSAAHVAAADRRSGERTAGMPGAGIDGAADMAGAANRARPPSPRRISATVWMGALLVVAVLGALGWWQAQHSSRSAPAVATRQATASAGRGTALPAGNGSANGAATGTPAAADAGAHPGAASGQQSVLELLSAARVAFRDQRLLLPRPDTEPRGDSALELYAQVLSQDPQNDEALDGVRRLFIVGKERIQADIGSGKLDDATRLLGLFKTAGVNGDDLQALERSVSAARPHWLAQRAQQNIAVGDLATAQQLIGQLAASGADAGTIGTLRQAVDAKKLELQLTSMANRVRDAIQAGALLQPADDNARTRFAAMRAVARTHPVTVAAQHELQTALIAAAGRATQAQQFDLAQRNLTAAADLGTSTALSDARHQLEAAMATAAQRAAAASAAARQAREAQQAAQARQAQQAAANAAASATAAPRAPRFIAAKPTHPLNVTYPDGTQASGYVIVEFTLWPDGSASDAKVVDSKPRGVFDHTALDAVQSGHYDSRPLVDGAPARARILLRFKHG